MGREPSAGPGATVAGGRGPDDEPQVEGTPTWLVRPDRPLFATLHTPPVATERDTAVMIVPPFGWEDLCSYRARRSWAVALARAGFPAVRFDLTGTGDSAGGPRDPGLVGEWLAAVADVAAWLRGRTGRRRVVALGIALGGILATQALADGAPIDDLILWGVPSRGRAHFRELRAYSELVASRFPEGERGDGEQDGTVEVTGFAVTAETAADLSRIRLDELAIPDAARRRVLLLERDELGVDERLQRHLTATGVELTVAPARDYAIMMTHPQEARMPDATIARTVAWLEATDHDRRSESDPQPTEEPQVRAPSPITETRAVTLATADGAVTETLLSAPTRSGRSLGVVSEPGEAPRRDLAVLFVSAGALRRSGPNRIWVEFARRWAARGVPVARFDLEGLGDADGDHRPYESDPYTFRPEATVAVRRLMDRLQDAGVADRFVLISLCSGAYASIQAELGDARVVGTAGVNPYAFHFSAALHAERRRRALLTAARPWVEAVLRRQPRPVIEKRRTLLAVRDALLHPRPYAEEHRQGAAIRRSLDELEARDRRTVILLGESEPLLEQFERIGIARDADRWPRFRLERLPSRDHDIRALRVQRHVHERLDRALDEFLAG